MAIEGRQRPDLSTLRSWTFLTNHAQVLLALARAPDARIAELAEAAQVTERAVYRILADLERAGYLHREKQGRRNRYRLDPALPLRDPVVEDELVEQLLTLVRAEVEAHRL
jgi:DNA-binding transcriptional ArsR family regulator